jgi:hypothetical protein
MLDTSCRIPSIRNVKVWQRASVQEYWLLRWKRHYRISLNQRLFAFLVSYSLLRCLICESYQGASVSCTSQLSSRVPRLILTIWFKLWIRLFLFCFQLVTVFYSIQFNLVRTFDAINELTAAVRRQILCILHHKIRLHKHVDLILFLTLSSLLLREWKLTMLLINILVSWVDLRVSIW